MCCDGDGACKVLGLRYLGRQSAGGQSDLNLKCCSRCSDGDLLSAVTHPPPPWVTAFVRAAQPL